MPRVWKENLGQAITTFPLTCEKHPFKLKSVTMRVLKAIYLSVLFTLAMGLFCGELPESMRLQDDTSNDFVADSSASAARENQVLRDTESPREQARASGRAVAESRFSNQFESPSISAEQARLSGNELLPLLSIRRT